MLGLLKFIKSRNWYLKRKLHDLDHNVHALHTFGFLEKLSDKQVENILHALNSDPRFKLKFNQLDHFINDMRLSGELKNLTDSQVENILYSLKSLGFMNNYRQAKQVTYQDDQLMTGHPADFLEDKKFQDAYRAACETYSFFKYDMRWAVYLLCWAAKHASQLEGDFVEYGAGRGGFAKAQMHYIDFNSLPDKNFYLIDSFWDTYNIYFDLPYADYLDKYFSFYNKVCTTFAKDKNVKLIKGMTTKKCEEVTSDKISFLGINVYPAGQATMAIEYFWNKLVPGAIVLLGDYQDLRIYKNVKWLFNKFAEEKGVPLLSLPTGQGLIIKPSV